MFSKFTGAGIFSTKIAYVIVLSHILWLPLDRAAQSQEIYREAPMLADAMSYAEYIYTPFIGIVGEKAMDPASGALATGPLTAEFVDKASEPKELVEIPGASHVSLYDIPEDVDRAIEAMDAFFKKNGGTVAEAA